jgi:large subunit ribosomal protein L24
MAKNKHKIKRGDEVIVIAGKSKGATGRVVQLLADSDRVVVEGVNLVTRHVKAQGEQPGQTLRKEAAVHISNVSLWNAAEGRRVKVGWRVEDGKKFRFDKSTGNAFQAGGSDE